VHKVYIHPATYEAFAKHYQESRPRIMYDLFDTTNPAEPLLWGAQIILSEDIPQQEILLYGLKPIGQDVVKIQIA
jgi:hypothetical protein